MPEFLVVRDAGAEVTTFEEYLRERGRSEHTIRAYLSDVKEFEGFLCGQKPSPGLLRTWITGLNHGRLNPQSIQRKRAAVLGWLAHQAWQGDTAAKVTAEMERLQSSAHAVQQKHQATVEPVTEAEYREAMGRTDPEGRALLSLLWWTGARVSEVVGDPLAGIPALTVEDGRRLVEEGHTSTLGKGGRRRILVLPTAGRRDLQTWVEVRAAAAEGGAPPPAADLRLFPMTAGTVRRILKRLSVGLTPHRFRHAYRARLRRAGVSDEVTHALMGHGPRDTTEGYGKVSLDEMLQAVEVLS